MYITLTMTEPKVALEITSTSPRVNNTAHRRLRITSSINQHYMSVGIIEKKMLMQECESMGGKNPV